MIEAIRFRASKALLLAAGVTAPRYMRQMLAHALGSMQGMAEEIGAGREGGVMITPWAVSEGGHVLASVQAVACQEVARDMRAEYGLRASHPTAPAGPFSVYAAQRTALEQAEFWIEAEAASGGTVAADILRTIREALGKPPA